MDHNEFYKSSENSENVNHAADNSETQTNAAPINDADNPSAPQSNTQESTSAAPQRQYNTHQHNYYNPHANTDEPAVHGNSYQPQNNGNSQSYSSYGYSQQRPQHDFSRYQNTQSSYTQIPRETVYINNQPESKKKEKAPRGRLGFGTIAAIVAVCMIFSGGAAFAGTYFANRINGSNSAQAGSVGNGTPSVIFQSYTNENTESGTYQQVADAVTPTVVEITTESISTSATFWGGNYVTSGAGSGVIISEDGMIITNAHVVNGANTITVKLKDGTNYTAELIGIDSDSDIAVIKVDGKNLPFALTGNSDTLEVGQEVVAVGNPLGELGGTVTNGIVSALSRAVNIDGTEMTLIQTNAAVNPGNSGGGLFNMYGELIGIVNAKSTSTSSGTSVEGIGFAIPINSATKVASELANYGYVRGKVMLGINYVDISTTYDAMLYRVNALGMYITASENEALKVGDRVTAIDGTEVTYSADVKSLLKNYEVGDEITVKVVRNGQYHDVTITLKEYVPTSVTEPSTDTSAFESNFGGK